jgi:hypothetical protein
MLEYGSNYSVNVTGKDLAGNSISYDWAFTTMKNVGNIEGVITDAKDNPIAGATVTLGNGLTTTTGADGHYAFDNVTTGTYNLTVTLNGYQTTTQHDVSTSAGKTTDLSPLSLEVSSSSTTNSNNGLLVPMLVIVVLALLGVSGYLFFIRRKK